MISSILEEKLFDDVLTGQLKGTVKITGEKEETNTSHEKDIIKDECKNVRSQE